MGILDRLFGRRPLKEEAEAVAPAAEEAAKTEEIAEDITEEAANDAAETAQSEVNEEPAPVAEEAAPVTEETAVETATEAPWGDHLQKRLDTYFARLRRDFPDGVVVRLNTQHKKLAERGAELRRLIGYEGKLDEFFALGGFTYQRSVGGRPSLPQEQTASVEDRLRAAFPDDVPTVLAVQQADHRL